MKWGKRNGPPYPLDAADHSASEKKAGLRDSLKEYTKYQAKTAAKGFEESVKHPKKFATNYLKSFKDGIAEFGKQLSKPVDTTRYRRNIFSKAYLMSKGIYDKAINSSENPLIRAASKIAKTEVDRLYDDDAVKFFYDPLAKAGVDLTTKVVFKKDYLNSLSEKDLLQVKKDLAYILLLDS